MDVTLLDSATSSCVRFHRFASPLKTAVPILRRGQRRREKEKREQPGRKQQRRRRRRPAAASRRSGAGEGVGRNGAVPGDGNPTVRQWVWRSSGPGHSLPKTGRCLPSRSSHGAKTSDRSRSCAPSWRRNEATPCSVRDWRPRVERPKGG